MNLRPLSETNRTDPTYFIIDNIRECSYLSGVLRYKSSERLPDTEEWEPTEHLVISENFLGLNERVYIKRIKYCLFIVIIKKYIFDSRLYLLIL